MKISVPTHAEVTKSLAVFISGLQLLEMFNFGNKGTSIVDQYLNIIDKPVEPTFIKNMIMNQKAYKFSRGQQDAQEMLNFIINTIDEFTVLLNGNTVNSRSQKNISVPKRSPLFKLFWGRIHSSIADYGRIMSQTIETFLSLPLEIIGGHIKSVPDALENYFKKETIEGYKGLQVTREVKMDHLPEILVLQLKYFNYTNHGLEKHTKVIEVPIVMDIDLNILSDEAGEKLSADEMDNIYQLNSIICHVGRSADEGHYICYAYHAGMNCWLEFDDSSVKPVSANDLQSCFKYKQPYVLFYRHKDTVKDRYVLSKAFGTMKKKRRTRTKSKQTCDPQTEQI